MTQDSPGTRKLPEVLTYQEQKMLLSQPNPKAPTGLRNLCVIRVMLNAGLRLSEVIKLTPSDLNLETGELVVKRSNGDIGRTLWLGKEDVEYIVKWNKIKPESSYLFCTLKGEILKDRYVREMVKRLGKKAGIEKNIFPHTLRHTFAADLYYKTRHIRVVQKALGHADLSTTMIYTYLFNEEFESALNTFINERQYKECEGADYHKETAQETKIFSENGTDVLSKPAAIPSTTISASSRRRHYSIHAIKCHCGEVIGRHMEHCPGCRKSIEESIEELKRDFHRVNFGIPDAPDE